MAVTRVTRVSDSGAQVGDDGSVRLHTVYRVECDTPLNDAADAVLALAVKRGQSYVSPTGVEQPTCLAESAESRKEDLESSYHYLVTVGFSSKLWDEYARAVASGGTGPLGKPKPGGGPKPDGSDSPLNPLFRPAVLRYGTIKKKMPLPYDRPGPDSGLTPSAVVNSAGDFFDPPYETEETWISFTIERNELVDQARAAKFFTYFDTVNSEAFLWFKRYALKCEGVTWESQSEPPFFFWKVVYSFVARPVRTDPKTGQPIDNPWILKLLDQGTHQIVSGKRVQILDEKMGTPVTAPVPLDGAGATLSTSAVQAGQFKYREFIEFPVKDFNLLLTP